MDQWCIHPKMSNAAEQCACGGDTRTGSQRQLGSYATLAPIHPVMSAPTVKPCRITRITAPSEVHHHSLAKRTAE